MNKQEKKLSSEVLRALEEDNPKPSHLNNLVGGFIAICGYNNFRRCSS